MEKSGRAIDSVSFTGWPDAGVIPFREHRMGTTEHLPKPTPACEMAGLYGVAGTQASAGCGFYGSRTLGKAGISGFHQQMDSPAGRAGQKRNTGGPQDIGMTVQAENWR